jgi:hypothetical protein
VRDRWKGHLGHNLKNQSKKRKRQSRGNKIWSKNRSKILGPRTPLSPRPSRGASCGRPPRPRCCDGTTLQNALPPTKFCGGTLSNRPHPPRNALKLSVRSPERPQIVCPLPRTPSNCLPTQPVLCGYLILVK